MSVIKGTSLINLLILIGIPLYSQPCIRGIIIEESTKLPIPFATITYIQQSVQKGVISDVHGKFQICESEIKSIRASCVGYGQKNFNIEPGAGLSEVIVELKTDTVNIGEVIVTPASNPAIKIIKKVLKNKDRNNFENYEKFRYKYYLKTLFNLKISYNATATDSATIRKNRDINKRASFISESVVLCSRINKRTENKIIALKTSGFENPLPGQYFVTSFHNSISFYRNNISLFAIPVSDDKTLYEYLSPVSDECLRSYNFHLEETYADPVDTTWVIEFHPEKGSNFNGLKGRLYISSNGYAIKNIVTEPSEKGLIDFKFKQDYEVIKGRWFPSRLNEEIGFIGVQINKKIKAYPVYLITSEISEVNFDIAAVSDSMSNERVYIDHSSVKRSDLILKDARNDSLTTIEKNTYQFMDSVGKKFRFDFWAELYPSVVAGKIPVKFLDIDLFRFYTNNQYEGTRIGTGLSTNNRFSQIISAGGFGGYGTKDKKIKYGGYISIYPGKSKETELKLLYQNNLKEPGIDRQDNLSLLYSGSYFRDFIASRMDNFTEGRGEIRFLPVRFLRISAALSLKEIMPVYEYTYRGLEVTRFYADEFCLSASFTPGELTEMLGDQKFVYYRGNPVICIVYKRGINIFGRKSYPYNRLETTVDITAYKGRIGQSDIRIAAGYIDRNVPYSLLFTGEGSKNNFPVLINNTFQTMKPYEFLSDRYVNIYYSHNFGSLLLETPGFKPKILVVQNTGWGNLNNATDHGIDFKIKNKVFLESGLLINNILRFRLFNLYHIGFGGGAFYRYGYYDYSRVIDNLALKFTVTLSLE